MDLLNFTNKNNSNSKEETIFENKHIKVIDKQNEYIITCFDEIGLNAMHETFQISPAKSKTVNSLEELEEFYNLSVDDNQEGIMIKILDKEYKAGKKVGYMYKMKPTSEDIDVVITAAEWGTGKRGGYLSSFYVSILDNDELKTIGKVGSGFKEDEEDELSIQKMTELLKPLITKEDEKKGIVYVKPKIIIQISYQDLQESQTTQSKYALRFPKVVALRTLDKDINEVNQLDEILKNPSN